MPRVCTKTGFSQRNRGLRRGAFSNNGQLTIRNRGILKIFPGDWIGAKIS
jgi:hypothetical protein